MKNNKGFTLIELLAVIVILAIIALIATPLTINIINDAKKKSFANTAYGLIDTVKLKYAENYLMGNTDELFFTFPEATGLNFGGERPKGGTIRLMSDGKISLAIYNDNWCAVKGLDASKVTVTKYEEGKCILQEEADVPVITLKGKDIMYIGIGKTFTDPGFSVKTVGGEELDNNLVDVKIIGQTTNKEEVDTSIEETYSITYSIEHNKKTDVKTRTVHVGNYDPTIVIEPNGTNGYTQETETTISVSAFEQYSIDGFSYNVTKNGVVGETINVTGLNKTLSFTEDGTYQIKVSVTDSEGNTNEYTSETYNIDATDPIISFVEGENGVVLTSTEASNYDLKTGVTVIDNNEITLDNVVANSNMIADAGDYVITYTATDIAGNTSSKIRKITVIGTSEWTFISNGTFTVPATGTYTIEMHGGGGGGYAYAYATPGREGEGFGGSGGGSGEIYTTILNKGEMYEITIGKGGTGGSNDDDNWTTGSITAQASNGRKGESTKFGDLYTIEGGNGGGGGYAYAGPGGTGGNNGSIGSAIGSLANGSSGGATSGTYGNGGSSSSNGQPGAIFITWKGFQSS